MGKLIAGKLPHLDDGTYSDGERSGLRFKVRGTRRNWSIQLTLPNGKRKEMGLGPLREVGLAEARDTAAAMRRQLRAGLTPSLAKRPAKGDAKTSLLSAVRDYHEREVEGHRKNDKGAKQWLASIENHVPSEFLNRAIGTIESADLLDVLRPIYSAVPETARRIRQRLAAVFDDAVLRKMVTANPVTPLVRPLRKHKRKTTHHRALRYQDAPTLFKYLDELPGTSARAVQFGMLTAARTGEILGMTWDEVAGDGKTWTVPAERMKMEEEHVVALSPPARAILKKMRGKSKTWVFPSPVRDAPASGMAMLMLLRRLEIEKLTTVHGLCRSTFSTWANETNVARSDVIEACLAHSEADRMKAAYSTAQFSAERRALLEAWAKFLTK
jgi:integrase